MKNYKSSYNETLIIGQRPINPRYIVLHKIVYTLHYIIVIATYT